MVRVRLHLIVPTMHRQKNSRCIIIRGVTKNQHFEGDSGCWYDILGSNAHHAGRTCELRAKTTRTQKRTIHFFGVGPWDVTGCRITFCTARMFICEFIRYIGVMECDQLLWSSEGLPFDIIFFGSRTKSERLKLGMWNRHKMACVVS